VPKEKNRPIGEKSPNLVTLVLSGAMAAERQNWSRFFRTSISAESFGA
jgi:hypothetical protein